VIVVLESCRRELQRFPVSIRADLADALARLDEGHTLSMPLCRASGRVSMNFDCATARGHIVRFMPSCGGTVYVVHAFKKTTQATAKRNIELACQRLKELHR
jgi:phage-related protein